MFANVWQTDRIARISPRTAECRAGRSDRPAAGGPPSVDVLNGIAYDAEGDRLFVTGKLWPKLFEIQLVKRSES